MAATDRPSVAELAALDAGLLDPGAAAALRRFALGDPRSAAVLEALAATRADLAALGDAGRDTGGTAAVAPEVARRWSAALAAEAAVTDRPAAPATRGAAPARPSGPSGERGARRRPDGRAAGRRRARLRPVRGHRPPRRLGVLALLATAAAVLLTGPVGPQQARVLDVTRAGLSSAVPVALGVDDLGPLADPRHRAGCIRVVGPTGAAPDDPVLGGRRVLLDGVPGVLMVLATGTLGEFRVLVVDPGCGPAGGTKLGETVVGA
jgi:hypothetical protein